MEKEEKQSWLDGLKVGDVVFCTYHANEQWSINSRQSALPITKITPTQFVTGGVGLRFKRTGGGIIGGYRGTVQPFTDEIKQRLVAEKLNRQLRYWFTELKSVDLTTEQLTAIKTAYEGVK